MFQQVRQAAEQAAISVSRRAFLGKLGQGALAIASLAGIFAALPSTSQAAGKLKCCTYWSEAYGFFSECHTGSCPKLSGAELVDRYAVNNCGECSPWGYG